MTGPQLTPIRRAWYRWKALRLPWRKRFLVGLDLQGNTYWEFHDAISAGRMRRIVEFPSNVQYSEIKLTPQWHQWLRHTRVHPPTLTEQSRDVVRQEQLKVLARRADERWMAKESYLDAPREQSSLPAAATQAQINDLGTFDGASSNIRKRMDDSALEGIPKEGVQREVSGDDAARPTKRETEQERRTRSTERRDKVKEDPWKRSRGGPSEEWQPQAWTGDVAPRR